MRALQNSLIAEDQLKRILIATMLVLAIPAAAYAGTSCAQHMILHGAATRAQFQCGFNKYRQSMIDRARQCVQENNYGETYLRQVTTKGFQMFDDLEKKEGSRQAACAKALVIFKGILAR